MKVSGFANWIRSLVLLVLVSFDSQATASDRSNWVNVQLYEQLNTKQPFDLSQASETTRYQEPAFGFVTLPTKYSANALPLDRSTPFALRAADEQSLPEGRYQVRFRSKGRAQLRIQQGDQIITLQTRAQRPNKSSHDALPPPPYQDPRFPELMPASVPHQEVETQFYSTGKSVSFELIAVIGGKGLVPSPGELSVSVALVDALPRLLSRAEEIPLTRAAWTRYREDRLRDHARQNDERRAEVSQPVKTAWADYHARVRAWGQSGLPEVALPSVGEGADTHPIDRFIQRGLREAKQTPQPPVGDLAFLRRLVLDLTGRLPSHEDLSQYLSDPQATRREQAIDRFLSSPEWADHWVSYWQDALAENPGILKPDLNNSGPFRWWIQQSFEDNLPMDRFAAELIQMQGSQHQGAPAAFAVATLNDAPMAAKGDILLQAFQAEKLSCARCHDAPEHRHKQLDTFSLAAMLRGKPVTLPESSTVPLVEGFRKPRVEVSLEPGQEIHPAWPFDELSPRHELMDHIPLAANVPATRNEVARHMVAPTNRRFAEVIVNRVWKRYLGAGLVEPAEDWEYQTPSHPELLRYLARELTLNGYDLKYLARLILTSKTYQARPTETDLRESLPKSRTFAGPNQRRLSAEQLVDSLFRLSGQPIATEELNLNPLGDRPLSQFLNLGVPTRSWEFAALMNERDRPSLALPSAQAVVDVLTAYGWRQSRMNPLTDREDAASPLQTLVLANGVVGAQVTRLTDDHQFTQLAIEADSLGSLIDQTFRRIHTRPANYKEQQLATLLLEPHYADRVIANAGTISPGKQRKDHDSRVSWANHFDSKSNSIRLSEERQIRQGRPPTHRLSASFREAYEDFLWSLINSAEFITIP